MIVLITWRSGLEIQRVVSELTFIEPGKCCFSLMIVIVFSKSRTHNSLYLITRQNADGECPKCF